ncbi:hypothetical protein BDN70DRAFT_236371 [Pholiota conissans]|uniref:Uncharacterized protein n=1 Tax=Pholiota conissans TaxID=109636 RepID=A0A9P5ZGC7_9AGAR|nr:hypothetical protein BDN70DRAFT_236371 [Pholiota conissans]
MRRRIPLFRIGLLLERICGQFRHGKHSSIDHDYMNGVGVSLYRHLKFRKCSGPHMYRKGIPRPWHSYFTNTCRTRRVPSFAYLMH